MLPQMTKCCSFLWLCDIPFSSVQFSRSVMSDSLGPHESQHARPLCPSLTPGVRSDSRPLSRWCHPTISSSIVPFSSRLQSFPELGSFPVSQFFASGGQRIGASASTPMTPMNIQDWFLLGLTGFDLLAILGTLKRLLQHHSSKASMLRCSAFFIVQLSHPYMTTGKTIALTRWTFVGKVMSLLFSMLSKTVMAFVPNDYIFCNHFASMQCVQQTILGSWKLQKVTERG